MKNLSPANLSQRALILIFVLTLALGCLGTCLSRKEEISASEQRRLAHFPHLEGNISSLSTWPGKLEGYLRDHIFLRQELVRCNALLRVRLLRHSPTFTALVGKNGWYFFTGDWALHDFLGYGDGMGSGRIDRWAEVIRQRKTTLASLGAHYLLAVAPNKEKVYPEFLPDRIRIHAGLTRLEALSARMAASDAAEHFLDLGESLHSAKREGTVYFMTDTHWTDLGALTASREILRRLARSFPAAAPLPPECCVQERTRTPGGDIALVMGLTNDIPEEPEKVTVKKPCAPPAARTLQAGILPGGKPAQVNGCSRGAPFRVLALTDSFGNALRPFLEESFQEVLFVRGGNLPGLLPFIEQYRPDIVLHLHVARFLDRALDEGP